MRMCKVKYVYIGIVFTCSTLHLFPYPVPANVQGGVQHVVLHNVPVDVLFKLWFSQAKHLMCHETDLHER